MKGNCKIGLIATQLQVGRTLPPGPSSSDSPPPSALPPPPSHDAPSPASSPAPAKMIETWVLIPPELSLVVPPQPAGQHPQVRVWTRVPVAQGRRWSPFQGTVRLGVIPATASNIDLNEVRSFFFCYHYYITSLK